MWRLAVRSWERFMRRTSFPRRPRPRRLREMRSRPPAPPRRPVSRPVPPRPEWLPSEKWAWSRIREGRPADFNGRDGVWYYPLPNHPEAWDATRLIRPAFLRDILLHSPWKDAVPPGRLEIIGAWIPEELNLGSSHIKMDLNLECCRFEAKLDLMGSNFDYALNLSSSFIAGPLELDGIRIHDDLILENIYLQSKLSMIGAGIDGQLSLEKSMLREEGIMEGVNVKGGIFLCECFCRESLGLNYATTKLSLCIEGFHSPFLDLSQTKVGAIIFDSQTEIKEAVFDGFEYKEVTGYKKNEGKQHITSIPAKILIRLLEIQKRFSPQPYRYLAKILREAGQLGKSRRILIEGIKRYRRTLSPIRYYFKKKINQAAETSATLNSDPSELSAKHRLKKKYYDTLNKTLKLDRDPPRPVWLTWLKRLVLGTVIGHGIGWRNFFAAGWAIIGIAAGIFAAWLSHLWDEHGFWWWAAYSLDKLIPFVIVDGTLSLSDRLHTCYWLYAYFLLHRLLGAVLVFFVVLGVTGLADRERNK